jgi:hypothetical protein
MQPAGDEKPLREYLSSVNHAIPSELLEPFDYVWDKKGKGIRSTLMNAFNVWLQIPKEKLVEVDHVISMLHNASLMYALSRCFVVAQVIGSMILKITANCGEVCLSLRPSMEFRGTFILLPSIAQVIVRSTLRTTFTLFPWRRR